MIIDGRTTAHRYERFKPCLTRSTITTRDQDDKRIHLSPAYDLGVRINDHDRVVSDNFGCFGRLINTRSGDNFG